MGRRNRRRNRRRNHRKNKKYELSNEFLKKLTAYIEKENLSKTEKTDPKSEISEMSYQFQMIKI
uniref:Uncharacterized protein n=1 Tax=viral metagenome TaxID=1070528 RepID=A0A6C0KDP7_9ZZZZ